MKIKVVEEASTLGWPPGTYKPTFEYEGRIFKLSEKDFQNGELVAWKYKSIDGSEFIIFND